MSPRHDRRFPTSLTLIQRIKMKGISPTVMQFFYVAMAVIGVVSAMSPDLFPSYIPAGDVANIIKTSGFIFTLYSGVSVALARLSSSQPGQWAQQNPPVVIVQLQFVQAR